MDTKVRFRVSNGSKSALEGSSDIGEVSVDGDLKFAKSGTFFLTSGEPVKIQRNGWHHSIQRIE